jgi:hypothetical protein
MAHITGHHRSQTLLLPESLDDYVSSPHSSMGLTLQRRDLPMLSRRRPAAQAMHRRIC